MVVAAAVVERGGRVLLTRRPDGTHLAGHWEFPGGKCEADETLAQCLVREMREELGVAVEVGAQVFEVEHAYPGRVVRLHFFACELRGEPQPVLGQEMRWATREELLQLPFPEADRALIEKLGSGGLFTKNVNRAFARTDLRFS